MLDKQTKRLYNMNIKLTDNFTKLNRYKLKSQTSTINKRKGLDIRPTQKNIIVLNILSIGKSPILKSRSETEQRMRKRRTYI